MFADLLQPQARRSILIEFNPYQVLVAGITRPRRGPVTIEFAAEFDPGNTVALREWLDGKTEYRRGWTNAVCGFVPRQGFIQRESMQGSDLDRPLQVARFIREQQARRSGSSAPFQAADADDWVFRAVGAEDGSPLVGRHGPQPALLVGFSRQELRETEQRLLNFRLVPGRVEPALLPLFGSLYGLMARRHVTEAGVVIVLGEDTTNVFILGKEGVHTPGPVRQGLAALVQQVRRDHGLESDEAARRRLWDPSDELRHRSARLVRSLGSALRPVIDSYEMTTGQPVGEIYCAYLPPALQWLVGPLGRAVGREPMAIDCAEWLPTAGLRTAPGVTAPGAQWLGALSLAAHLPERATLESERTFGHGVSFQRSWHVDSRSPADFPERGLFRSRVGAGALAGALMVVTVVLAAWQWHVARTLQADLDYWRQQMTANQQLFDELTGAVVQLDQQARRLDRAHELMATPFQASEFLMSVGRSLPPRMRLERIESNPARVLLGGTLLEPAEEASRTLGAYMDGLRRAPEFGGRFTSISATSLQRQEGSDALAFEITLRLPSP